MAEMSFRLQSKGGKYFHISETEGRRLSLSKASLGLFCFEVLRRGGEIIQLWPFNPTFNRSAVYPVVAMTADQKKYFEDDTGFKLVDPPKVSVC